MSSAALAAHRLFVALTLLTAACFAVAPFLILAAPEEPSMGLIQRIFYFHVPAAWVMFLAVFVCAGASLAVLRRRSSSAEQLAIAAAELAVAFGLIVLCTGPMWARKAWGTWWQWDVRLTTSLLLWMIFVAVLLVRRYGGPAASKLAAGLALFGAADVPLIYVSVSVWRTLHPRTTVVSSLDPAMRLPFFFCLLSFTLLFCLLLWVRFAEERNRARLDALYLAASEAGIGE